MEKKLALVATDLDGTLLRKDKSISNDDLKMLEILGQKKILRVVATGRNFRKVREVIPEGSPVDFIAFSSGAGIYDCNEHKLLYYQNIENENANRIISRLVHHRLNFYLFRGIPENFRCWYYRGDTSCQEFERYFGIHSAFTETLPDSGEIDTDACQFLIIFKNPDEFTGFKLELEEHISDIKIVRASSPLETGYVWMEIFHSEVSKGNAVQFLCQYKNILPEHTLGIGNDYNDMDMLDFTSISYLVENGPDDLKGIYRSAPGHEESAFSACVKKHI